MQEFALAGPIYLNGVGVSGFDIGAKRSWLYGTGALGFVGALPGWGTKQSADLSTRWRNKWRRDPSSSETATFAAYDKAAELAKQKNDEIGFEFGWAVGLFHVDTGRAPNASELDSLLSEATVTVDRTHDYQRATHTGAYSRSLLQKMGAAFKDVGSVLKDALPYAQSIISFVPGIGTGVSAAISAGMALAEGQNITDAVKEGVKGALPGGPVAAAAFDTALKVAGGANVGDAALESSRNLLPEGAARTAFDTGIAVAHAVKAQAAKKATASVTPGIAAVRSAAAAAAQPAAQPAGPSAEASHTANEAAKAELARRLAEVAAANKTAADKAAADLIALSKLTPKELQGVKDMQALAKLTPQQQQQLVAYATAAKAAADAKAKADAAVAAAASAAKAAPVAVNKTPTAAPSPAAVAPPTTAVAPTAVTATAARTGYGPYPASSGAVHGLGFSWGIDTKWRWFIVQANGRTMAQRGPLWLSDSEAMREELAFRESMLGRGYIGTVTRWDWNGTGWQRATGGGLRAA